MLPDYLCGLCRRQCTGPDKEKCLKAPALNLGSGFMLKRDHINFDTLEVEMDGIKTDILGDIQSICHKFEPDTFNSIFCVHVIEHFYIDDALKLIADCYRLLRTKGVLVLEGPDILKTIQLFSGPGQTDQLLNEVYGDPQWQRKYGPTWTHKWGWTGERTAQAMKDAGFEIRMVGDGHSHSHPERDFRVEGVKP